MSKDRNRREVLKSIGTAAVASTLFAGSGSASDNVVRRITPSTRGQPQTDSIEIKMYENGTINVEITGQSNPRAAGVSYQLDVTNAWNKQGDYTPQRAVANVKEIDAESNKQKAEIQGQQASTSDVSTTATTYNGGAWARTVDGALCNLAELGHEMTYYDSSDGVDFDSRQYYYYTGNPVGDCAAGSDWINTHWYLESDNYTRLNDLSHVESEVEATFYNTDFGTSSRTEAWHEVNIVGEADGSFEYTNSIEWSGEGKRLLAAQYGTY